MKENVLYIDGGSTTTKVYFKEKNEIIKKVYKGLNLQTRFDHSVEELKKIKKDLKAKNFIEIYIGAPGSEQCERVDDVVNLFGNKVNIVTDIKIQQLLFCKDNNYLAISFGSGTVMIEKIESNERILAGWGHLFGDEGSAYHFSQKWICQAINDYENRVKESNFIDFILCYFKFKTVEDIKNLYSNQSEIKIILQNMAVEILVKNYIKYFDEIEIILELLSIEFFNYLDRINIDKKIKTVYLFGGMIKNDHYFDILKIGFIERGIKEVVKTEW